MNYIQLGLLKALQKNTTMRRIYADESSKICNDFIVLSDFIVTSLQASIELGLQLKM